MRKIKIYLDGIVNSINAQNDNCANVARFLDKDRFKVRTLTCYSGELPIENIRGVRYLHIGYPARVWSKLKRIIGVLWCDVAYFPPLPGSWRFQRALARMFRKKVFQTVEGVYEGIALERAMAAVGPVDVIKESLTFSGHTYSITHSMVGKNRSLIGLDGCDRVLRLGVDSSYFARTIQKRVSSLQDVVMIGADLYRKGLSDYLLIAKAFPNIRFHVVGGNIGGMDYGREISKVGLGNVVFHGQMSHAELKTLFEQVQLHIFPSHYESFGKVTFETAAAGIPSIVYADYGADEWITTGVDGFVVKTVEEIVGVVEQLVVHPELLQSLSDHAIEMAKRWDWRVVIKDWEREIEVIYRGDN